MAFRWKPTDLMWQSCCEHLYLHCKRPIRGMLSLYFCVYSSTPVISVGRKAKLPHQLKCLDCISVSHLLSERNPQCAPYKLSLQPYVNAPMTDPNRDLSQDGSNHLGPGYLICMWCWGKNSHTILDVINICRSLHTCLVWICFYAIS